MVNNNAISHMISRWYDKSDWPTDSGQVTAHLYLCVCDCDESG